MLAITRSDLLGLIDDYRCKARRNLAKAKLAMALGDHKRASRFFWLAGKWSRMACETVYKLVDGA